VRTARAKGLSERRIVWVHVLRNAAIPIITYVMSNLPGMLIGDSCWSASSASRG